MKIKEIKEKIINFFIDFKNAINQGSNLIYRDFKFLYLKIKRMFFKYKRNLKDFLKFIYIYYFSTSDQRNYIIPLSGHDNEHFIELIEIINYKLKFMRSELKKDYDFDNKDLDRLNDIISISDQLIEKIELNGLVEKDEEYQRLAKSFFNKLYRIHDKLYSIVKFQNYENKEAK
jgi:hypothetical protein